MTVELQGMQLPKYRRINYEIQPDITMSKFAGT